MINSMKQGLDFKGKAIIRTMIQRLNEQYMHLKRLRSRLEDLSPLSVLKRGYSITMRFPEREILKDAKDTKQGDKIKILLSRGSIIGKVLSRENGYE